MNSGNRNAQRETFSLLILSRVTRKAGLVAIKKQSKKDYQKVIFFDSYECPLGWQ